MNPYGKAIIKAAEYIPPHEPPCANFPFALITGRTLYHFHTRTKTARAPQLQHAAPQVWVEVSQRDARRLGISEGDTVEVSTPRGSIVCATRLSGVRDGVLFVPFHYGYWDAYGDAADQGHHRAGNELTLTDWDPVSKQPIYKTAAARLRPVRARTDGAVPAPTTTASAPVNGAGTSHYWRHGGQSRRNHRRCRHAVKITLAIRELHRSERKLAHGLDVMLRHRSEPTLLLLADLRRIRRIAAGASLEWELLGQAAQAAKDLELLELTSRCHPQTLRQTRWANAMLKGLSPQALTS